MSNKTISIASILISFSMYFVMHVAIIILQFVLCAFYFSSGATGNCPKVPHARLQRKRSREQQPQLTSKVSKNNRYILNMIFFFKSFTTHVSFKGFLLVFRLVFGFLYMYLALIKITHTINVCNPSRIVD